MAGDKTKYDEQFLTNYADINVVPAIKRVKGVGNCQSFGSKTYTIRMWLDPAKMKQHNLIPSDLVGILAQQNIEAAPGSLGEQTNNMYEYTIRYKGRLQKPEEFADMIISTDDSGQTLRVKDVRKLKWVHFHMVQK